jgi:hypothetical protein
MQCLHAWKSRLRYVAEGLFIDVCTHVCVSPPALYLNSKQAQYIPSSVLHVFLFCMYACMYVSVCLPALHSEFQASLISFELGAACLSASAPGTSA